MKKILMCDTQISKVLLTYRPSLNIYLMRHVKQHIGYLHNINLFSRIGEQPIVLVCE